MAVPGIPGSSPSTAPSTPSTPTPISLSIQARERVRGAILAGTSHTAVVHSLGGLVSLLSEEIEGHEKIIKDSQVIASQAKGKLRAIDPKLVGEERTSKWTPYGLRRWWYAKTITNLQQALASAGESGRQSNQELRLAIETHTLASTVLETTKDQYAKDKAAREALSGRTLAAVGTSIGMGALAVAASASAAVVGAVAVAGAVTGLFAYNTARRYFAPTPSSTSAPVQSSPPVERPPTDVVAPSSAPEDARENRRKILDFFSGSPVFRGNPKFAEFIDENLATLPPGARVEVVGDQLKIVLPQTAKGRIDPATKLGVQEFRRLSRFEDRDRFEDMNKYLNAKNRDPKVIPQKEGVIPKDPRIQDLTFFSSFGKMATSALKNGTSFELGPEILIRRDGNAFQFTKGGPKGGAVTLSKMTFESASGVALVKVEAGYKAAKLAPMVPIQDTVLLEDLGLILQKFKPIP